MSVVVEQARRRPLLKGHLKKIQFKKRMLLVHPATMFRINKNLMRSPKLVKYSSMNGAQLRLF
jgi:hypothetical protein